MNWPEYVVDLLDLFDETIEAYNNHAMKKAQRKNNGSSGRATDYYRRKG